MVGRLDDHQRERAAGRVAARRRPGRSTGLVGLRGDVERRRACSAAGVTDCAARGHAGRARLPVGGGDAARAAPSAATPPSGQRPQLRRRRDRASERPSGDQRGEPAGGPATVARDGHQPGRHRAQPGGVGERDPLRRPAPTPGVPTTPVEISGTPARISAGGTTATTFVRFGAQASARQAERERRAAGSGRRPRRAPRTSPCRAGTRSAARRPTSPGGVAPAVGERQAAPGGDVED